MNHKQEKKIKKGLSRVMQRDLSVVSLWGANGPVNKAMYYTSSVKYAYTSSVSSVKNGPVNKAMHYYTAPVKLRENSA